MNLGSKLQILREKNSLSQEEIAEKLSVSRQSISKWERDIAIPELSKLIMLSEIYGVTLDNLVRDDGYNKISNMTEIIYNENELIDFLLRAKKETYAGKGSENSTPSRPQSHDLEYCEGQFRYIDTYLGSEKFMGEEAVWHDNIAIWGMNYVGRVLSEDFSGNFLKECLLLNSKEYPFRGPLVHQKGKYKYHSVIDGDFEWFKGYEEIFYNDMKVYECLFHGGKIKE